MSSTITLEMNSSQSTLLSRSLRVLSRMFQAVRADEVRVASNNIIRLYRDIQDMLPEDRANELEKELSTALLAEAHNIMAKHGLEFLTSERDRVRRGS